MRVVESYRTHFKPGSNNCLDKLFIVASFYIFLMDNFIEIQFDYQYYSKNRITPLFIGNDELLALSYDDFYSKMLNEVPHLAKITATPCEQLRMIVVEESRPEIDLSPKYFKSQMARLLNKGLQTIVIRVVASESPLVAQQSKVTISDNPRSKRRLDLVEKQNCSGDNFQVQLNDNSKTIINQNAELVDKYKGDVEVILPLERHAKKHEEKIQNITGNLQNKTRELEHFDGKLSEACHQNGGHLTACGNCHLKVGHTRKACSFSPCRSAFSCGILAKHNNQKSIRASLVKEVSKLQAELTKAKSDLDSARTALANVNNSSNKRIEDILVNEEPHRYIINGRRNWLVLNKDIVRLQSKLKGSLPTRNNVINLLSSMIKEESSTTASNKKDNSVALHDTDHRMAPQKRILENDFGIRFPTKRARNASGSSDYLCLDDQEKNDFHIALKMQQEEIENDLCDRVAEDPANDDDEHLQLEADAAAALLHLKARK